MAAPEFQQDAQTSDLGGERPAAMPPVPVVGMAAVATVLCVVLLPKGAGDWRTAPFPFIWRDVALVHLASCLPIAGLVAAWCGRKLGPVGKGMFGSGLLALSCLCLEVGFAGEGALQNLASAPLTGGLMRWLPAVGLTTSLMLISAAVVGAVFGETAHADTGPPRSMMLIGLTACLLLPAVYTHARSRHELAQVSELLKLSRLGEAQPVLKQQLEWNPSARLQGTALSAVLNEVEQTLEALRSQVAAPLPGDATGEMRLERARHFAILGLTQDALAVLDSAVDSGGVPIPAAENLRGTIHQARREWALGHAAHARAKAACAGERLSPEIEEELRRALRGLAYCDRKRGRYLQAEAAYVELLRRAPTAETHFLLAQFYEDTQQTRKAEQHVLTAMSLDPWRYTEDGETLLNRLVTVHFGCFGVFSEGRGRSVRD